MALRGKIAFLAMICLSGVTLFLLICRLGMIQFAGFDNGIYTNSAWQMHLGFRPYQDLVGGYPPLFLMGAKWAFDWFGVQWFSLVRMGGLFASLTLLIHVWLLGRIVGIWWGLLLACYTQAVTALVTSCWSHDWTSAVIAALFYTAVLAWREHPDGPSLGAIFLLGVVLLLSKANYAGVYYVLALVGLIAADLNAPKIGIRKNLVLFGSMIPAAVAALLACRISPLALFRSYLEAGDRVLSARHAITYLLLNQSWEVKQTVALLLPALVCVVYIFRLRWCSGRKDADSFVLTVRISRREMAWLPLLAIGPTAAVIAMATNNSYRMGELPPALISLACLYVIFRDSRWTRLRRLAARGLLLSVVAMAGNSIRLSVTRFSQSEHLEGNFYDPRGLVSISAWPYFDGLMAGPKLAAVLLEMQGVLRDQGYLGKPNAKVYIGPRIDFGYAVFGIRPVPGLPLWWESYSNADLPKTQVMVERFKQAGYERIILLQGDHTFFPATLVDYIRSSYQGSEIGLLTVYRKL
jgi:hypothetical protein